MRKRSGTSTISLLSVRALHVEQKRSKYRCSRSTTCYERWSGAAAKIWQLMHPDQDNLVQRTVQHFSFPMATYGDSCTSTRLLAFSTL